MTIENEIEETVQNAVEDATNDSNDDSTTQTVDTTLDHTIDHGERIAAIEVLLATYAASLDTVRSTLDSFQVSLDNLQANVSAIGDEVASHNHDERYLTEEWWNQQTTPETDTVEVEPPEPPTQTEPEIPRVGIKLW